MGKKYYCDFCDKSFADNPTNRRNHIKGVLHQKLRTEHYNAYKDPATIYAEEIKKIPCRNFFSRGDCKFGSGCIYTHYTPEELQQLARQAKSPRTPKVLKKHGNNSVPKLDDWLKKWKKRQQKLKDVHVNEEDTTISGGRTCSKNSEESETEVFLPEYHLPACLQGVPNLPPSLLPPPPDALNGLILDEWG